MINIRKGTFETNSSSTHSICITKNNKLCDIPDKIDINIKKYYFGWEYDKFNTIEEKLAYLIMGVIEGWDDSFLEVSQKLNKIIKTVGKWVKNINIEGIDIVCYKKSMYYSSYEGEVDHAMELKEFVEALLQDEKLLKRYLFSKESFILTGNDNEDGYQEIKVSYDHDEFFKGN